MGTHSAAHRMLTGLAILLALLAFTTVQAADQDRLVPIKSPADNNQYRYLNLENDLKVLLVSDPDADKAAASLNIAVGSGNDPAGREGMAHFLEHMLFLGTEKYPDPGEYQQFIRSHGGSHNAFTAFQDTNYFFDIQASYLEPALDRFAQQFAAPLFTPELVDRERNAVHSEYSASLKDDGRRYFSVRKAISNPGHSFSQFSVGNLVTLDNTEERPLRDDLIEFWENQYSANLMTLAVYGPQSLDELEAMVRPRFQVIENRELAVLEHTMPLFDHDTFPARLQVQTIKDVKQLQLIFPIGSQQELYPVKPLHYVASLLGHEGPGSLFDILKRRGWVESLYAGSGMDTGVHSTLELGMTLTQDGLRHQDEIVALTFDYIDLVREQGINQDRFEEARQLAEIDFRFQQRPEPLQLVMRLSMEMQEVAPEDVLQARYIMTDYAPDQYRELLQALTPENVLITVRTHDPLPDTAETTTWYDTSYVLEKNISVPTETDGVAELAGHLALPGANPFVPEDLSLVDGESMARPDRLATLDNLELWFSKDTRFGRPEANIFLSLRSPLTTESPRGQVLTHLLAEAVSVELNPWAYPARTAGLNYQIYPHLRGLTVRAGGYHDRLPVLLNRIVTILGDPVITEQRFQIARQRLMDNLRNRLKDRPVSQAATLVQDALIEGAWTVNEKLAAAEALTVDDLRTFAASFTDQADAVMLIHGNATRAFALNTAAQTKAILLNDSRMATVSRSQVRALPDDGQTEIQLAVPHPDTGYLRYHQGRDTEFPERARYRLLTQIVSGAFYEEIRTQRQMGYIVYATPFEMLETPAIGLVVQSPEAGAEAIDKAVSEFAAEFRPRLADMDESALERERQAVISKLTEQERTLSAVSERYWQEIDRQALDFDTRQQLADAVAAVSKDELLTVFDRVFDTQQASLLVLTGPDRETSHETLERLRAQPPLSD